MEARDPSGTFAAEENERKRIAREIHDDFGQRAAALAMLAAAAAGKVGSDEPLAAELKRLRRYAGELGEDLRRFSHQLHPARLERRGLAESLRIHAAEVADRHGLELELELPEPAPEIPFELALALFRVAQQGLDNVVRHAGARRVRLSLRREKDALVLRLADDGRGFGAADRKAGGLGLTAIAERAELFGGGASFDRGPLGGAQVAVWTPLPEPRGSLGRLRLLLRRHRGAVAAALLTMLALAAGLVVASGQARRARQEAKRADATVRFLESLFEAGNPRRTRGQVPDARVLLERGSRLLENELAGQPLERARLLDTLGGIETELGLYPEAAGHLAEALQLQRGAGADALELASTLGHLGRLARFSGKGDSPAYYREALALREERLGAAHPETIRARADLGTSLAAAGKSEEAERLLREALRLAESSPVAAGLEARILHNLAGLAHRRQDLAEGERLLERALAIRERLLPADDPDRMETEEAMAVIQIANHRPAEAARLLERLLAETERIYGLRHPAVARLLYNLALSRRGEGRDTEARKLLAQASEIAAATLDPSHPVRRLITQKETSWAEATPAAAP